MLSYAMDFKLGDPNPNKLVKMQLDTKVQTCLKEREEGGVREF